MATHEERRNALEAALRDEFLGGAQLESRTDYNAVIVYSEPINHLLHFTLSYLTAGIWLLIWLSIVLTSRRERLLLSVDDDGIVQRTVLSA